MVIELRLFTQTQTNYLLALSLGVFSLCVREIFPFHNSIVSSRTILFSLFNVVTLREPGHHRVEHQTRNKMFPTSFERECECIVGCTAPYSSYHYIVIIILVIIVKKTEATVEWNLWLMLLPLHELKPDQWIQCSLSWRSRARACVCECVCKNPTRTCSVIATRQKNIVSLCSFGFRDQVLWVKVNSISEKHRQTAQNEVVKGNSPSTMDLKQLMR